MEHQSTEQQLLDVILGNDFNSASSDIARRRALSELLEQNYDWLFRYFLMRGCERSEAEDCLQETLLQIAKSIGSFRRDAKLSTWMYTIAKRCFADYVARQRRGGRVEQLGEEVTQGELATQALPEELILLGEQQQQLMENIRQLPEKQRDAVFLHYFEDQPLGEIATRLGCSQQTVKTHLYRARGQLKRLMEEQNVEGE